MVFRFIQIRFKENSNDSEPRPEIIFSIYSAPDAPVASPALPGRTEFPLIKMVPIRVWRPDTTLSCHPSARSWFGCKNVKTCSVCLCVVFKDS